MVKYRSASLPSTPSLYSAECDQNKQKSTQSSSSSAIDHDHPTKRCLDPPRMLTLTFFVAPIRARLCLPSIRKKSKIFPKRNIRPLWTKFQRSPSYRVDSSRTTTIRRSKEIGRRKWIYKSRTVSGSSRGREGKLANYCG